MSKEISNFILPEKTSGRFIQVYINSLPFIRFNLKDDETHEDLLRRLLTEYHLCMDKSGFGHEYIGKGFYKTLKDGTIQLYGDSIRESVQPDQKHFDKLAFYLPKGTKIAISEDLY